MRGKHVFMDSLRAHGVTAIFGNPGTTENALLETLVEYPDINYVIALQESIAVCAAGFCARASGQTVVANVHVAPGLGNAIGMMYGCLKAHAPVVITAGQQDTRMRLRQPILSHDLVAMAAPVTKWAAEPRHADEMAEIMRRAFQIANEHPKGPVFVALPNNVMEQETTKRATVSGHLHTDSCASIEVITRLSDRILISDRIAILAGDELAAGGATKAMQALAQTIGAHVFFDLLAGRFAIGPEHINHAGHLPNEGAKLNALLSQYDLVLAIGGVSLEEVWFDDISIIPEQTHFVQIEPSSRMLATKDRVDFGLSGDLVKTLLAIEAQVLADADEEFLRRVQSRTVQLQQKKQAVLEKNAAKLLLLADKSPLVPVHALAVLAAALPDDVIVVDESITAIGDVEQVFGKENPDEFYAGRGGGIGQGVAGAVGTAVAHNDRIVVAISGDGSAMYSIQSLWTAAHHNLNIVFVILANEEYRVLKHNIDAHRMRFDTASNKPYPHMDLTVPTLQFVALSEGMGVAAERVETEVEIKAAVKRALEQTGPYLIELVVSGKQ